MFWAGRTSKPCSGHVSMLKQGAFGKASDVSVDGVESICKYVLKASWNLQYQPPNLMIEEPSLAPSTVSSEKPSYTRKTNPKILNPDPATATSDRTQNLKLELMLRFLKPIGTCFWAVKEKGFLECGGLKTGPSCYLSTTKPKLLNSRTANHPLNHKT